MREEMRAWGFFFFFVCMYVDKRKYHDGHIVVLELKP